MNKNKKDPTPWLGKPKRDEKVFTYTENKLLDQITIEIMECWRKDLAMMRSHYAKTLQVSESILQVSESVKNVTEDFEETFPKIEKMLTSPDFIFTIERMEKHFEVIMYSQNQLFKHMMEIETKLSYPKVSKLCEDIENIHKILDILKFRTSPQKKKWWKKFFGTSEE